MPSTDRSAFNWPEGYARLHRIGDNVNIELA